MNFSMNLSIYPSVIPNEIRVDIENMQKRLGYHIKNINLLLQALTRQSAIRQGIHYASKSNNQRLQWVGSNMFHSGIVYKLYEKYANNSYISTDYLNKVAINITSNMALVAEIGKRIGLASCVFRGSDEEIITSEILAHTFLAILGSITLDDGGQKAVHDVIERHWKWFLDNPEESFKRRPSSFHTRMPPRSATMPSRQRIRSSDFPNHGTEVL
ncbi:Ribonuclease 3 [Trichoplax sp. H2]|uniref:RNase III domain-containing protein n=1 Tax=Trichoplax adhaerens TaxID=10228 RepID=B3RZN8_TRIAD|nr:hypothetical protein TRIADDRAFT_57522 [Trichoplax adhaerens]EDV23874.1 hypothetical protein TRIADDRAFT_57522 [Trichoplax adhaerens]RDD44053.1 Ribonuclease 3 [Trichoplax sp. H2]|eukprot:XP_002113400.1 hypothetical protein TRIADDRAFT_57522 [Trichoplax adhaerens]